MALLAGCAGVAPQPAASVATLTGAHWRAVEIDGAAVPAGREGERAPYIVLGSTGEGRVSGFSGCNALTGSYRLDGESLAFGPLAMTRKACTRGEAGRIETAFARALGETASWRIAGDRLELRDRAGAVRARFVAGEAR